MPATNVTTGSFVLEVEGQSVPVSSIEGGAAVGVVVIAAPTAGSRFREKHLSGVRYEPIAIRLDHDSLAGNARTKERGNHPRGR